MHFLTIASFGLLATEALALPKPESTIKKRGLRIPATHSRPKRSLEARDGSAANHWNGGGWLVDVQVGPSTVTLNIDTGSADLWVASTLMPADQQGEVQTGHGLYDPGSSSTAVPLDGENFNIAYVDGSGSSGPEYTENVNIGGATLPNFAIGVCNDLHLNPGASSRDTDGPVGLAFQYGNSARPTQQPTFAEALLSAGAISAPMFATHFKTDDSGSILFGAGDSSLYSGSLVSVGVDNSTGAWLVPQVGYGVNGQQFSTGPITMIADSGGPGLDVPSDALAQYWATVPGAAQDSNGSWYYPCGTALPDFDLFFGNADPNGPTSISIPGGSLPDGGDGTNCYTWMGAAGDQGSFGVPFFSSQYIEFDMSGPSMRFAAST